MESPRTLLVRTDPELFNHQRRAYWVKAQGFSHRRPIVISLQLRDALLSYITEQLTMAIDFQYRDEMVVHLKCLEAGQSYRGNFYFAPLIWSYDCEVSRPFFPRLSEVSAPRTYFANTSSWNKKIHAQYQETGLFGAEPPHPWRIGFVKVGDVPMPACFHLPSSNA